MKIILCLLSATALLCGCATYISNPEQSARGTTLVYDPYAGGFAVTGKRLNCGDFPNKTRLWLRGGFDKNRQGEFFQLYVYYWSQTGWMFLKSASDSDAMDLPLRVLNQDLGILSDTVEEHVAVDMTRDYLIAHFKSGFNIRIVGSKGNLTVRVPGMYVEGFLNKFDLFKTQPAK